MIEQHTFCFLNPRIADSFPTSRAHALSSLRHHRYHDRRSSTPRWYSSLSCRALFNRIYGLPVTLLDGADPFVLMTIPCEGLKERHGVLRQQSAVIFLSCVIQSNYKLREIKCCRKWLFSCDSYEKFRKCIRTGNDLCIWPRFTQAKSHLTARSRSTLRPYSLDKLRRSYHISCSFESVDITSG